MISSSIKTILISLSRYMLLMIFFFIVVFIGCWIFPYHEVSITPVEGQYNSLFSHNRNDSISQQLSSWKFSYIHGVGYLSSIHDDTVQSIDNTYSITCTTNGEISDIPFYGIGFNSGEVLLFHEQDNILEKTSLFFNGPILAIKQLDDLVLVISMEEDYTSRIYWVNMNQNEWHVFITAHTPIRFSSAFTIHALDTVGGFIEDSNNVYYIALKAEKLITLYRDTTFHVAKGNNEFYIIQYQQDSYMYLDMLQDNHHITTLWQDIYTVNNKDMKYTIPVSFQVQNAYVLDNRYIIELSDTNGWYSIMLPQ